MRKIGKSSLNFAAQLASTYQGSSVTRVVKFPHHQQHPPLVAPHLPPTPPWPLLTPTPSHFGYNRSSQFDKSSRIVSQSQSLSVSDSDSYSDSVLIPLPLYRSSVYVCDPIRDLYRLLIVVCLSRGAFCGRCRASPPRPPRWFPFDSVH